MAEDAIALVGGQGLGDNLVEMVLLYNAHLHGYATTVYSDVIYQMQDWFPQHRIERSLPVAEFPEELESYTLFFWSGRMESSADKKVVCRQMDYISLQQPEMTQVENMQVVCHHVFPHHQPVFENGISPPAGLNLRKNEKRVCIHPTSAEVSKNWVPERFLQLGDRLQKKGFEPVFIMSKAESEEWQTVVNNAFPLIGFSTIADCAAYLYESGYFIGNDSGGGHLASCLGIPTLSIHGRKKKARLWQPGWGHVRVATPRVNFIGNHLRQHYWKYLLTTGRVERCFKQLVQMAAH